MSEIHHSVVNTWPARELSGVLARHIDHTRNTLDLSLVPAVQRLSRLPIRVQRARDRSTGADSRHVVEYPGANAPPDSKAKAKVRPRQNRTEEDELTAA